jgi:transcriptional regulator GlxA family with amidase domain
MESIKIVIFLFDGMTALDAVGPYEVLSRIPNSKVYFVSMEPGIVCCMGGLNLVSEYSIKEITETDILVIPGGFGIDDLLDNVEILNWIRNIHRTTKFTTSVCTGSLLLGAAGILTNLKATTHWNHIEKLKKYNAEPVKSRYVIDGKVITSAGVSAGIDMSLKLVELVGNESLSKLIQLSIEYDPSPPFDAGSPEKISKELLEIFHKTNAQKAVLKPIKKN